MIRRVEVRRGGQSSDAFRQAVGVPYRAESHPEDLERELAEERARAKLGLYSHVGIFVAVMTLLAVINLSQSPDRLWFVWPLLGWGVAVVAHAVGALALGRGGAAERYLIDRELRRI
jgi:hypothetical protein